MNDYSQIPPHMRSGLKRYVDFGIHPGDFMRAILANDFLYAARLADKINLDSFKQWAFVLNNEIPLVSRGSYEIVDNWIKKGGLSGFGYPIEEEQLL